MSTLTPNGRNVQRRNDVINNPLQYVIYIIYYKKKIEFVNRKFCR